MAHRRAQSWETRCRKENQSISVTQPMLFSVQFGQTGGTNLDRDDKRLFVSPLHRASQSLGMHTRVYVRVMRDAGPTPRDWVKILLRPLLGESLRESLSYPCRICEPLFRGYEFWFRSFQFLDGLVSAFIRSLNRLRKRGAPHSKESAIMEFAFTTTRLAGKTALCSQDLHHQEPTRSLNTDNCLFHLRRQPPIKCGLD